MRKASDDRDDFLTAIFRNAAMKGNSDIVEFALANFSIPHDVFRRVPMNVQVDVGQHLDVLKLIYDDVQLEWISCIEGNRMDIVAWIANRIGREEIDEIAMHLARRHRKYKDKESHKAPLYLDFLINVVI